MFRHAPRAYWRCWCCCSSDWSRYTFPVSSGPDCARPPRSRAFGALSYLGHSTPAAARLKMPKIGRCALKATLLPKTARWRLTGVMSNHLSGAFRADLGPLTCRFCGLPLPSPPSAPKLAFGGGGGNPWPVDLSGRRTRVASFAPPGKRLWPPRSARAMWRARSSGWASRAHAMYNSLCSPYIAWSLASCRYRAHFRTQIAGAQVLGDTDRVTER